MQNIAITGSFASGKTFILKCLESMGYKVFSCDEYIKKLYENISVREIVVNSIEELASFNKKELAKIIFKDKESRKKLEGIIHPMVREAIKKFEIDNKEEKYIFTEVPLLFESGFDKFFAYSICVFCSETTRFNRAKSRGINDEVIFEQIKKIQLSQEEKKRRADFIIDSENSEIKVELENILNKIG